MAGGPTTRQHVRRKVSTADSYIDADIREPDVILAKAAETLDFGRPVALLLLGILGHLTDAEDPEGALARLVAPLAPGSHVVINDGTDIVGTPGADGADDTARARAIARYVEAGGVAYNVRSPERITGYFGGMELLEPGVVTVSRWRGGSASPWAASPSCGTASPSTA